MAISYTFTKKERLKSRKQIGLLFKNRQSVGAYPLRLFWAEQDDEIENLHPLQTAFSVSKRTFKQAVKRNRHKRLLREAHRLHKHKLYERLTIAGKQINMMLVYVAKDEGDLPLIEKKYLKLVDKLCAQFEQGK